MNDDRRKWLEKRYKQTLHTLRTENPGWDLHLEGVFRSHRDSILDALDPAKTGSDDSNEERRVDGVLTALWTILKEEIQVSEKARKEAINSRISSQFAQMRKDI